MGIGEEWGLAGHQRRPTTPTELSIAAYRRN
jgi:hypothetical protein